MSAQEHLSPEQFNTSLAEGHRARGATVPLYHRTMLAETAQAIRDSGFKGSTSGSDTGDVYFSSRRAGKSKNYGDHMITVDMPHDHPRLAHADTWKHSNGQEHWYSMKADHIDASWIRP